MLIVGEKINTSRPKVKEAVANRDTKFIRSLAREQQESGANMIDVNCGTFFDEEPRLLSWLVQEIQDELEGLPLCIDSPNPKAIEAALKVHHGTPLVNSISGERERYNKILPLIQEYKSEVVLLCMDDEHGISHDFQTRFKIASRLIDDLIKDGISAEKIYVDPLVQPISTDSKNGVATLETIKRIKETYPGVRTICGISNISFGLPERRLLNQVFVAASMTVGLDAVILDPNDRGVMSLIITAKAILNQDPFCSSYLQAFRKGLLGGLK